MKLIDWLVLGVILGGGGWYFCRNVGENSRNTGSYHDGGIDSSRHNGCRSNTLKLAVTARTRISSNAPVGSVVFLLPAQIANVKSIAKTLFEEPTRSFEDSVLPVEWHQRRSVKELAARAVGEGSRG